MLHLYLAFPGINIELRFSESVIPDVLHILPASYNTIVHGIVHFQHISELTGFITDHQILEIHQEVLDLLDFSKIFWLLNKEKKAVSSDRVKLSPLP